MVQTDVSNYEIGAVLSQRDLDGCGHPVAYFSLKNAPPRTELLHSGERVFSYPFGGASFLCLSARMVVEDWS